MLGRRACDLPPPGPRPLTSRGHISLSSFKALLLKTGSPACTSSRISAVERLCTSSSSHRGAQAPDVPLSLYSPLLLLTSPLLLPPSPLWGRPPGYGSAPPCSSSRRFAARCRLPASPLTAIFEEEEEVEEEKEEEEPCQPSSDLQDVCRIHYSLRALGPRVPPLALPLMESSM
ncbi:hypothetical protein NHX12_015935 [Muraenolepis orangiensis]|uniref:Uncharacterized protein n=1 Tax=Muraenolepis orangiensis TaxID=630683 RepID=A0A9Q0D821_9TELE|nr:hypothetical protein NHX12_015935 [Muraenolepis orangiensis]